MRTKEWRIYGQKVDFVGLGQRLGVSPLTVRIMCNRGLKTLEEMRDFLHPDRNRLHAPQSMKDVDRAAALLIKKIGENKTIRIVGDYDIDGVCSTAILYRGLKRAGAMADWYIPHRVRDGYGLNRHIVEQAVEDGIDTLLTCDNGISARAEVALAKKHGMTVIVTDHHDIPSAGIPAADAVVNPKQADCTYPFKGLCGAGVAWKLVWALFEQLQLDLDVVWEMVDLAAIATIGDVMELLGENRLIVQLGLERLQKTSHPGLQALIMACGLQPRRISSYHVGFVLGPAINAGGRLDTAALAENLLLREELDGETMKQAEALKTLNDSRKTMTVENTEAAIAMVDESALTKDPVLVVYLPECGESIAGIVAGRLREHYYKPSIVLTDAAGEEGMAKGSGRSIPGYEMFQELERVGDLLTRFGGHPMAAGLSLKKEHISEFRRRLNANCTLTAAQLKERLWIDIPLPVSKISIAWIEELHQLEPFGKGNEKPLFADKDLQIRRGMILGKDRNVLKLQLESVDGCAMEALIFHEKDAFLEEFEACYGSEALEQLYRGFDRSDNPTCMSMVYEPSVNDYRGVQTVQVIIEDFHLHQKNENV